jgi:integrase
VFQVDVAILDRFYAELRRRGRKDGKPMSPSSVRDVHAILSGALGRAVAWGWRSDNPAERAVLPPARKPRITPPAVEAAARLLEAAAEDDAGLGLFLRLAVILGARRGELRGLRWSRVDPEHGEVLVARGVIYVPGEPLIERDTKTYGERRVALDPATLELLRAHRERAEVAAEEFGVSLPADAYVFSRSPDGLVPMRPDGMSHRFAKLRKRLGVTCRLHDLRHFMVTQLVASGMDVRTIAGRAGHGDGGRMTLGTYAHFQRARDQQAAELLAELVASDADGASAEDDVSETATAADHPH